MRRLPAACCALSPTLAWAGMPSVGLTDLAQLRLQTISFFLVALLLSAVVIMLLWNRLRVDFPRWPRLGFTPALVGVLLLGLVFNVVLTMIAGARELLTPGAWDKQGLTYKLSAPATPDQQLLAARTLRLEDLRSALWTWAAAHEGRLPPDARVPEVSESAWRTAHPSAMRFIYAPGRRVDEGRAPVAWEPGVYGAERLVLFSDGSITSLPVARIHQLAGGQP